jgi:ribonucleotide reductase alpha subunit
MGTPTEHSLSPLSCFAPQRQLQLQPLQFDLWGVTPSDRWDWAGLKAKMAQHGLRNSLLLAPMPTASTAQILVSILCACVCSSRS